MPGECIVTMYSETVTPISVTKMIALINEAELISLYVPFLKKADNLKKMDKATKICYSLLNFPVISDREVYYYGEGFDRFD